MALISENAASGSRLAELQEKLNAAMQNCLMFIDWLLRCMMCMDCRRRDPQNHGLQHRDRSVAALYARQQLQAYLSDYLK
jgi:hypothetical protein